MNKKKIGALLVGATLLVGAMGSFAYFTSHTSIGGRGEEALQELQIQNGQVVITAKVASNGLTVSDWTYDVAKLRQTVSSSGLYEYAFIQFSIALSIMSVLK